MQVRDSLVLGQREMRLGPPPGRALMDDLEEAPGALDRGVGEIGAAECRNRRARRKQQDEQRAADQQRAARRPAAPDRASDGIMPESATHPLCCPLETVQPALEKTPPAP